MKLKALIEVNFTHPSGEISSELKREAITNFEFVISNICKPGLLSMHTDMIAEVIKSTIEEVNQKC